MKHLTRGEFMEVLAIITLWSIAKEILMYVVHSR